MKSKIAIIGSGISGLSAGQILKDIGHDIVIFEMADKAGGLVRCTYENGNLFHRVGGHVFNSKIERVASWFWSRFDKDEEFIKAKRNAQILLKGKYIGYPIENFFYQLSEPYVRSIISELLEKNKDSNIPADNFSDFLIQKFGSTLYKLYFEPYNKKIWNTDLKKIPLHWLDGKLPMPKAKDIFLNNILKKEDYTMVHSEFFYPKLNGSSFIINRLSEGLNIYYNCLINEFTFNEANWIVNGQSFDMIIYTGDVRRLSKYIKNKKKKWVNLLKNTEDLRSNGTSNALCFTDDTDLSWLYIPDKNLKCHRIIYTGNFSPFNNKGKRKTCTVEFSGYLTTDEMRVDISKLPGNLIPIAFNYEPNSYVIQYPNTREKIDALKINLEKDNFYLLGRFAEWEYYNMDTAIHAAMKLVDRVF